MKIEGRDGATVKAVTTAVTTGSPWGSYAPLASLGSLYEVLGAAAGPWARQEALRGR